MDCSATSRSLPFSSWSGQPISTTVRTSCPARKARAPTGTFLSNRMRKAVALGEGHNRFHALRRNFKLFGDFRHAQPVVEVIDNRAYWHPRSAQHKSAALHSRPAFYEGAFRPVDSF